jgi:hypothetical protein
LRQPADPIVPTDPTRVPVVNEAWSQIQPTGAALNRVRHLIELIKRSHAEGPHVALAFACRRCQPIKERDHPGWEYTDNSDPTREVTWDITTEDYESRRTELFALKEFKWDKEAAAPYWARNPPPAVSPFTYVSKECSSNKCYLNNIAIAGSCTSPPWQGVGYC